MRVQKQLYFFTGCILCIVVLCNGCHNNKAKNPNTLFQKLLPSQTHIHFRNDLAYDDKFNIYTYRNLNNDKLPDIFFTANMGPNKLYLNKGNFQFEDISEKAGIGKIGKWSTGVS